MQDREQVKQIAREAFWELVDNELLPLLKDFVGARLVVSGSQKEPAGTLQKEAPSWSPLRIPWKTAEGEKGPYERAEDPENPEFRALVKDLQDHKKGLTRDGLFYWLFTDGKIVGRKKVRGL